MFASLVMARNHLERGLAVRSSPARWIAIGVAVLLCASCGGSPTSPSKPVDPPVRGAPAITCPPSIAAASSDGTPVVVRYAVPTPTGGVAPVRVSCAPESGSPFSVGSTSVQCTALASDGQTGTCSFPVTITPPQPILSATRFLAFGDSITLGEVTTPVPAAAGAGDKPSFKLIIVPTAAYPRQLQLQLAARYTPQPVQVVNAGVAGESAATGAGRFQDVIRAEAPEVALLLEGVNDLAARGTAGISIAAAAIESMAKEARMRNVRVFIATLPPPKPGGKNHIPAATIQAFNARLVSIAAGEGAILVDVYAALAGNVDAYIGSDGLHPTEIGYERVAGAFFTAIKAALEVRED
jgi:lysophospholipase L1-like esterase